MKLSKINTNIEIRNIKQFRHSNFKVSNVHTLLLGVLDLGDLKLFRASDFEFRICIYPEFLIKAKNLLFEPFLFEPEVLLIHRKQAFLHIHINRNV